MALPSAEWDLNFDEQYGKTTVKIIIKHKSLADLEQIIQMSFQEGFTIAITELENILLNLKK